ncbi:MAG: DUF5615 family PIN-like protein [Thermoanaerobaculia bacterium]
MIRLAADENFNGRIVRGLRRRIPGLDIVRIQDAGLCGADDSTVLAWAAAEGRILLTHDVATTSQPAYKRVLAGLPMPGVVKIARMLPVAQAIGDLVILVECSDDHEWKDKVLYLPL